MTTPDRSEIIDVEDEELVQAPYPGYSRIRERMPRLAPTHLKSVGRIWMVARYADVAALYTDPRFVANPLNVPGAPMRHLSEEVFRIGETPEEYMTHRVDRMGQHDGAAHARLRRLVGPAFAIRPMERLRPRIERLAEELLDRLPEAAEDDGTVDLLRHYALQLPNSVLCELIGIPETHRAAWLKWTTEIKWPSLPLDARAERWRAMTGLARELIAQRRAAPAEDLISSLLAAGGPDGELTDTEIVTMMLLDHNAHRSIGHLIANGTAALLAHPDQLRLLIEDPGLMPQAIEELLRYCGPTTVGRLRHATQTMAFAGGTVRKGEVIWAAIAGANWDPRRFTDPSRLDVSAPRPSHIAFGGGPHHCSGPALARLAAEVAIAALLRRHPGLTLGVDPSDLRVEHKPRQMGLLTLPIRL
ncbi:MAG: cytochrome P450 [Streptosporangiales bacterium]|nr:cytochrome P450 [Streptosporangiales bacterium]